MNAPRLAFLVAAASLAVVPAAHAETRSLEQISIGPQAGPAQPYDAAYSGSTPDGSQVFFTTDEQLVPADQDNGIDIYMRAGGATTLISPGTGDGQVDFEAVNADATRVIIFTADPLTSDDTDNALDLYEWHSGTISLLSDGRAADDPEQDASYQGATPDLAHVYFSTQEPITADDVDSPARDDIFDRSAGATRRVSVGTGPGHDTTEGVYQVYGAAPDGSRVYWGSAQSLSSADNDPHYEDIYEWNGGTTSALISDDTPGPAADYADHVNFLAMSADGTKVAFDTDEDLTSDESDGNAQDVFLAGDSGISLATPGTDEAVDFAAATPDLSRVAISTTEQLQPADTDGATDLYVGNAGSGSALATPGSDDVSFSDASKDLSRIFFGTYESLTGDDQDGGAYDTYEQHGGTTSLVTTGPADPQGADDESIDAISDDGTRAIFSSGSAMTSDDTDGGLWDVYERTNGVTRLLTPASNDQDAGSEAISPDGKTVVISSMDPLTGSDTDGTGTDVFASRLDPTPAPPAGSGGGSGPPADDHRGLPTGPPADLRAPLLRTSAPRSQRLLKQKGIVVTLSADEDSTATASGVAGKIRFKSAKRALRAGAKARVRLTLPKAALKKAGKALRRHKKLKANVTVVVTDAAGNRTSRRLTIALKR